MAQFQVQEFVDRQPFRRTHMVVAAIALLALFIDGFDIFMVGKIAPAIADGFQVSPDQLTLVFVLQQTGLAIGSFVVSPLYDLCGRKRLLVVSFVAFGLLTIAGAFAQSIEQLAVLRGVAGLFLAGVVPAALALVSEVTPLRNRSSVVGLAQAGYSAGNAAGASLAFLVPTIGWEGAFWIGGLFALGLAPFLAIFLHESIAYLVARRPGDPRIAQTLQRLAPDLILDGTEEFVVPNARRNKSPTLMAVFGNGRAVPTFVIWLCYLLSMGNIALLASWLPTYYNAMAGVSIQDFAVALIVAMIGGLAGISTVGFLMDRIPPLWLVACYYGGNATALILLGQTPFGGPLFTVLLVAFAFFQSGGQGGLNVLLTQFYPPSVRSTGLGWAGGVGRLGGVALPALGGLALTYSLSLEATLTAIAISPLLVMLLLVLVLRPIYTAAARSS
jgi:AAHS family 4-hydroxybenzoate transporter-like MFS transporter